MTRLLFLEPMAVRRRAAWLLAAAALVALFAGCANAAQDSASGGSLVVSLPASLASRSRPAKTILPDFASIIDSVSVSLSASGQNTLTKTASSSGSSLGFTGLAATSWTVSATLLHGGTVIGTGRATVSVSVGSEQAVTIPITLVAFGAGTGSLSIPISWPSSTGVDYLSYAIDGGGSSAANVSTSGSDYATTISASLAAGTHQLSLAFRKGGSSGTSAGVFVETVDVWSGLTSAAWLGSSTAAQASMKLSTSDFLSSNASLGDLSVQDGSSSGATLSIGFSSSTTSYDLYALPSSGSIVITPMASEAGQYITYSWNGGAATPLVSGSNSSALVFGASSHYNVLAVTVCAPDGATTRSYTLTWHRGTSTVVGVTTSVSYAALGFPSSAYSISRGDSVSVVTSDSSLAAIPSGWKWYIDGVEQGGMTGPTFSLGSATTPSTSAMVGVYQVSAALTYDGVVYSGGFSLTVSW